MMRLINRFMQISTVGLLSGCFGMPATEVPIPSLDLAGPSTERGTLVVMLPGRGDRASNFADAGFGAPADGGRFDVVATDAHLGYYMQRSLLDRLHDDIVEPAKAAGYDQIWLLGVSMGGLGSLLYAAEHPDDIDGIILLAPYMGDRKSIEAVLADGSLADWNGEGDRMKDYEVDIWKYLQNATTGPQPTPIILGYGTEDRMARGYSGLVDKVDFAAVYTREGGHKWTTWRPLWDEIAADLDL